MSVTLPSGMPRRMRSLPVNPAGYPIPWFIDQTPLSLGLLGREANDPDFRYMDGNKLELAVRDRRCWVCGQRNNAPTDTFVIGPMCAVNRTSAEPPSHRDCAEWSAIACPFLSKPKKVRREVEIASASHNVAGVMIERNPGVALVWTVRHGRWRTFDAGNGTLFDIGEPTRVAWFAHGRPATRDEVMESIGSGLPILREMAEDEGPDALAELDRRRRVAIEMVPS